MATINSVVHTNRHSIDRVLNAGAPVLLVFARGDRPLESHLSGALERAAAAYAGKLLVARIDAGDEAELVRRFAVGQTPALVAIDREKRSEMIASATAEDVDGWARYLASGGARPGVRAAAQSNAASKSSSASAPPAGEVAVLTDATFARATAGPFPTLVDFWAPWCAPCRMVAPSVERLGREYAGRANVAKLNVDENPATSQRFGVRSIPTLLILRDGREIDRIVGAQPYEVLRQRLERAVAT